MLWFGFYFKLFWFISFFIADLGAGMNTYTRFPPRLFSFCSAPLRVVSSGHPLSEYIHLCTASAPSAPPHPTPPHPAPTRPAPMVQLCTAPGCPRSLRGNGTVLSGSPNAACQPPGGSRTAEAPLARETRQRVWGRGPGRSCGCRGHHRGRGRWSRAVAGQGRGFVRNAWG